jgi:hypothetical protein
MGTATVAPKETATRATAGSVTPATATAMATTILMKRRTVRVERRRRRMIRRQVMGTETTKVTASADQARGITMKIRTPNAKPGPRVKRVNG